MRFERLLVPIYLPKWVKDSVVKVKRAFIPAARAIPPINILGERNVEWAFLSTEMPNGPGEALEFGCEQGYMSLLAAERGFRVLANDLQRQTFTWQHPNVTFCEGDFLGLELPLNHFDIVINCSSVEHVGVAGRYGITTEQHDGDIEVMQRFSDILRPGGLLLMTAPCGQDTVLEPWCRVYGSQRLPKLFAPFQILKEVYWVKDSENRWVFATRGAALAFQPRNDAEHGHWCAYALGCFVLRKSPTEAAL